MMMNDNLTPLEVIEEAKQFAPIYLGGSRRMHQLSGDEERLRVSSSHTDNQRVYRALGVRTSDDILVPQDIEIPITDATDYDFYATYSNQLEAFLVNHEFQVTNFVKGLEENKGYVMDNEAVTILERNNVQIVLRKDAEFYRLVFDNIEPWFYKHYLWKSSGTNTVIRSDIQPIFNMLFAIAHAARGDL